MLRNEDMVSPNKSVERYDLDTGSGYTLVPAVDYSGTPPGIGGYPMTYTDSFIQKYYRRNGDLYKINPRLIICNDYLIHEDIKKNHYAVSQTDIGVVFLNNTVSGIKGIKTDPMGVLIEEFPIVPSSAILSFDTIKSNETGIYFTAKLTGDSYTNIYRINDDLTYDRLTDDTADYTEIVPKADEETFAVLKTDGSTTNLVLFKADTGEETVIAENIDSRKYEAIGWNAAGTLFVYDITTGYVPGTSCPYQFYPVTHRVGRRNIEIFVFSPLTSNIQHPTSVFSLGKYSTVMKSKPSLASYNGSDHIIYSKYFSTRSNIYAIPVERIANISNEPDVFDYEAWFSSQDYQTGDPINPYGNMDTTGGSEITDPVQRTEYVNMNLNPYKKKLENGPVIRYLYTGREMNIETNDYYYRMRMMDSSVGRFNSKDPILYLNLYRYVANNPMHYFDPWGYFPWKEVILDSLFWLVSGLLAGKAVNDWVESIPDGSTSTVTLFERPYFDGSTGLTEVLYLEVSKDDEGKITHFGLHSMIVPKRKYI